MDFVGEACETPVVLSRGVVRYAGPTADAFGDVAVVEDAGLEPPHVTSLARMIGLPDCVSQQEFLHLWKR